MAIADERLLTKIRKVQSDSYEAYGYRRTWKERLRRGEHAPRCQVQRLMREAGIQGAKRRGKPWRTTKPDLAAHRPADLVDRDFTADHPNELWVADFTYLRNWQGTVFFSFVIDVFSRAIVGWRVSSSLRSDIALDAAEQAIHARPCKQDLVHHSDHGVQAGFNGSSQHVAVFVLGPVVDQP